MSGTSSPASEVDQRSVRRPEEEGLDEAVEAAIQEKDEQAFHELILDRQRTKFIGQIAEMYPGDRDLQEAHLRQALNTAKRRIPRRIFQETHFHGVKGKALAIIDSLQHLFTDLDGQITDEGRARAQLDIDRWESGVRRQYEAAEEQLKAVYYGLVKEDDPVAKEAEKIRTRLYDAMGPFRRAPPAPAPAPDAAPTPPAATPSTPASTVVTARAFVVKDYVPVPFTGEGDPREILGGFRSWEAEWEDARVNLDKCPGATAPIRLIKLQQALGGAALKLIKSIPTETEDGYDLAVKKLRDTYHNPVGLATALLKAAETDKRPRCFLEAEAHIRSLKAAMEEEGVELDTFYFLYPVLDRLSPAESASWAKYVVSLRTRYNSEQKRVPEEGRVPWKIGMGFNLESFSNWREESLPDQQAPDEAGVHLAGSSFPRPDAPVNRDAAGWSASHNTASCLTIRRMDSTTWGTTAAATNACVRCGARFGRFHRCPNTPCSVCGVQGHLGFRCGQQDADLVAFRIAKAQLGQEHSGRRRGGPPGSGPAPKRPKSSPAGQGAAGRKGHGKKSPGPSPSSSRQPPGASPGTTPQGRSRAKKPANERQKAPPKE